MEQKMKYQSRKKIKKIVWLLILVLLVLIPVLVFSITSNKDKDQEELKSWEDVSLVSVETKILVPEKIRDAITFSSVAQPWEEVKVSPEVGGRVEAIYAEEGDRVQAGEAICRLEQSQALLASYNTALNNYETAQDNLTNTISYTEKEVEMAEIGVSMAERSLESAKRTLSNTEDKINTDLDSVYQNAQLGSSQILLTSNNTLISIKEVLDNYAQGCNDDYCQSFMTTNVQAFNDLMSSYPKARTAYKEVSDYYDVIKSDATPEQTEELLTQVDMLLSRLSFALEDLRDVLEHAIIYDGLTVNQLNAAKSEVYANQSLIETASKTVENIKQSIASLKIGNTMSYDAAKLAFDLAEKDLENAQKRLLNAQTQAEIQVNSAESQVKAAKEQVDVAKDQLAKTVVYSPLTGIIGKKYINVGEIAMVGAPIFTVVNTDFIKVEIHLTEFDIGRVALGQNVEVSFSAYPGEIFSGIIYQIDSVADSSKKFPVRIQIDNRDGRIKAGMVAKTNIILSEEANVLVVPREAVFMQKNAAAVYVIGGDDRIEIRLIETEQIDEENLRVVEGLETGDEIVMQGNFDLSAGQEVKIKK